MRHYTRYLRQRLEQPNVYGDPGRPSGVDYCVSGQSVCSFLASVRNELHFAKHHLKASPNWLTASDAVPVIAFTVTNTSPARFFRLQQQQ